MAAVYPLPLGAKQHGACRQLLHQRREVILERPVQAQPARVEFDHVVELRKLSQKIGNPLPERSPVILAIPGEAHRHQHVQGDDFRQVDRLMPALFDELDFAGVLDGEGRHVRRQHFVRDPS